MYFTEFLAIGFFLLVIFPVKIFYAFGFDSLDLFVMTMLDAL